MDGRRTDNVDLLIVDNRELVREGILEDGIPVPILEKSVFVGDRLIGELGVVRGIAFKRGID